MAAPVLVQLAAGRPTAGDGAPHKRASLQQQQQSNRRAPRPRRRPVQCAANNGGAGKAAPEAAAPARSSSRLTRLLSWRSNAAVAEDARPTSAAAAEAPAAAPANAADAAASLKQQQQQRQPPAPPAPSTGSLYSWLTWGSVSPAGAAPTNDPASSSLLDAAALSDGMAADPAAVATTPAESSRSWYRRTRSSLGALTSSLGSIDEGEAAALAAAQQPRPEHPALQLMRARALAGSRPGQRSDAFKLGLVVEGGGMRGCVSGGALQALTDLGLRDCFDAVYGSSAGAINSTYFLSGQRTGVDIYHQHIATPEFINLKRLWKSEGTAPVLDLSFLIDHVMHSVHPLDWEAVLASPLPLKVVASSLDTLDAVLLQGFADRGDLAACLKASATVPAIAGGPRHHRGHRLVDAAVFEPVPFRSAIADGCTHLLVLCTRPTHLTRRSRVNTALSDAMEVAIKKAVMSPDYMLPAWQAEVEALSRDGGIPQDDMLLKALSHPAPHELPWFAGVHCYPLYPGPAANLSPLCTDVATLKAGVAEGRRNVMALAQALLGDVLDPSVFDDPEPASGSSNIVAAPSRTAAARAASARLWRRYVRSEQ